ncbi:unnamed protein product [Owenia fusiformis]|uniref:Uncharacterized protein n=1 Tax=Owenia fusiformis TaxID=6347 RepID=A0A8J1U6Q4_OWEFU|nr:unnamed protein product [Owenia fusiformis]
MSKMYKVIVLWVWLLLLALLVGLPIRYSTYGPETVFSSPGDMRHIQKRFNSFMCTGLEITNKESEMVDVYTTSETPYVDKNKTLTQTIQRASRIDDMRFEYWGYHLIAGSEVTIRTTVNANVELYIAKGVSGRNKWRGKFNQCKNNCENQLQKDVEFSALYKNETYLANLSISTTDDYFFIYARSRRSEQRGITFANINMTFFLRRTRYNLSNTKKECILSTKANKSCTIDLPYRADRNILLTYDVSSNALNLDVITTCIPREWVYLVFFLGLPFAIGLILSGLIMLLCKDKQKTLESDIAPNEKTVTLDNKRGYSNPVVQY